MVCTNFFRLKEAVPTLRNARQHPNCCSSVSFYIEFSCGAKKTGCLYNSIESSARPSKQSPYTLANLTGPIRRSGIHEFLDPSNLGIQHPEILIIGLMRSMTVDSQVYQVSAGCRRCAKRATAGATARSRALSLG